MTDRRRSLAERRIAKTAAEGRFEGLAGEGKPLPDRSGEARLDIGTRVGDRMMAEAGALHEDIRLRKALDAARAAHAGARTEADRRAAMARIASAELAYDIAVEAPRRFLSG